MEKIIQKEIEELIKRNLKVNYEDAISQENHIKLDIVLNLDETLLQELNDLHDKASSFTPRSDYEIKDKNNLLQQINDLKDFLQL